jgi:hypothetical protein
MTTTNASADHPRQLVLLPRTDHFFAGQPEPPLPALGCWLPATNLKEEQR